MKYCSLRNMLVVMACALIAPLSMAQSQPSNPRNSQLENSVVKIFTTSRNPDMYRPWQKGSPQESTGSGVVIEGNRILTNAHVVNYASKVEVRAKSGGDKLPAKVIAIARGIDLAVLELEDTSFFKDKPIPSRASTLPEVKDEVLAFGYPVGGNSLSITKGIVSRIEFVSYSFPTSGLRIQIDAAINPGNSGGPVFAGGKMIGVAFAGITSAQNIGYIIPNEEVELFLKDIADGKYDGKPALFDDFQTLENPSLRRYLKVDSAAKGMVVQRPAMSTPEYPLKEWDLVTHIGKGASSMAIDNQGMVQLTPDLQVRFQYAVQKVVQGGLVPMRVVRGGRTLDIEVPVATSRPRLIPSLQGGFPPYFIYGPMVFSRATTEFRGFFNSNAGALNAFAFNAQPLLTRIADEPSTDREDLVVVSSPFFPHRLVSGYDSRFGSVVKSVNDMPVRSLKHFVEIIRDMKDELVVLKFDQKSGESIVIPHKAMMESTEGILNDNGIRFLASSDLLDVWAKKP